MNDAEVKLQEKLARVERLETKLSDSIITIQKADVRLNAIELSLENFQKAINELAAVRPTQDRQADVFKKQIQDLFINFTNLGVLVDSIKNITDKSFGYDQSIKSIGVSLADHTDRICKADAKMKLFSPEEQTNGRFTILQQVIGKDQKRIDELSTKIDADQNKIEQISSLQRACSSFHNEIKGNISDLDASIKKLSGDLNTAKVEYQNKLDKISADLSAKIDAKIKESIPSLDVQKIAEATKDLIKTDIAFIRVDSQNASLKYNNLDTQVALIEKRIESIFLMLKKLELKQAS